MQMKAVRGVHIKDSVTNQRGATDRSRYLKYLWNREKYREKI